MDWLELLIYLKGVLDALFAFASLLEFFLFATFAVSVVAYFAILFEKDSGEKELKVAKKVLVASTIFLFINTLLLIALPSKSTMEKIFSIEAAKVITNSGGEVNEEAMKLLRECVLKDKD